MKCTMCSQRWRFDLATILCHRFSISLDSIWFNWGIYNHIYKWLPVNDIMIKDSSRSLMISVRHTDSHVRIMGRWIWLVLRGQNAQVLWACGLRSQSPSTVVYLLWGMLSGSHLFFFPYEFKKCPWKYSLQPEVYIVTSQLVVHCVPPHIFLMCFLTIFLLTTCL